MTAALEMIELGGPLPSRLLLIYPVMHTQLPECPEVLRKTQVLPLGARFFQSTLDMFWDTYLKDQVDVPFVSVDRHDLSSLPRCLVVVNEYDDLRASGEAFAEQACSQGVIVQVHVARGMIHGHLGMTPLVPETDATLDLLARYVVA